MNGFLQNMKVLSYSRQERKIAAVIIPPTSIVMNFLIFGLPYFQHLKGFILTTLFTMLVVLIVYTLCSMVATIGMNRFPAYSQTFKRIGLSLLSYILIMITSITVLFFGYDYMNISGMPVLMGNYPWVIVAGSTCNLLATSFNEGAAFFEKWRKLVDEAENLKKENLQSQLEGLKGQVNPHFLFNSLNSLSSLISEDPDQAETFLDEMSKVYRYLLRTNEEGLTTLDSEMGFIHSYFHLLKTRYGEGLDLETIIDDRYLLHLIPTLTLQMLVENAVKHNMILKDHPLKILILTTNSGKLVVSNNLQRKDRMVSSNKVGLTNIVNKYRLMKQEEIAVRDDGKEFAVIVPLIQPAQLIPENLNSSVVKSGPYS
jgi:sensor histidine kinase YesM